MLSSSVASTSSSCSSSLLPPTPFQSGSNWALGERKGELATETETESAIQSEAELVARII